MQSVAMSNAAVYSRVEQGLSATALFTPSCCCTVFSWVVFFVVGCWVLRWVIFALRSSRVLSCALVCLYSIK